MSVIDSAIKPRIGLDVYFWGADSIGNAVPIPAKLILKGIGDSWHLSTFEIGFLGMQQNVTHVDPTLERVPKPKDGRPWILDPRVGHFSFVDDVIAVLDELVS